MCGKLAYMHGKRGRIASETLRTYTKRVYPFKHFPFHIRKGCVLGRLAHFSQKLFFCNFHSLFRSAAYAHPHDNGRTRICPCFFHRLHDAIFYAFDALRRFEHKQPRHVFAAKPFGQKRDLQVVALDKLDMNDCRRVVLCVLSCYRVENACAVAVFCIAGAHALVYRVSKQSALDVHVLPQPHEKHRHTRVLTHCKPVPLCQSGV